MASFVTALRDLGLPGAIGVVLGWLLTRHTTARTLVVQQKREAATLLLDALVDARLAVSPLAPTDEIKTGVREARSLWWRSVMRYLGRIGDAELTSRVDTISLAFTLASAGGRSPTDDFRTTPPPQRLIDIGLIVDRAFLDVFYALDAFIDDKQPPPRAFPEALAAMQIMTDESHRVDDDGLADFESCCSQRRYRQRRPERRRSPT
jgi:hypothetical protein